MMLAFTLSFAGCFIAAHVLRGGWEALPIELCRFREGESAAVGFAMFFLLGGVGLLHVTRLFRHPTYAADARICIGLFGLLAFVSVTSANDPIHVGASLLLLGGLFVYFTVALERSEHPLHKLHLIVPLLLLAIPPLGNFGSWQKGMILYLVALINIQYFMLGPPPRNEKVKLTVKRPWKRRRLAVADGSVFVRER